MNERIKQLAVEAGYEKDEFGVGHWDMPQCKKFAELIVKECIRIDEENRDAAPGVEIARHFGIEDE